MKNINYLFDEKRYKVVSFYQPGLCQQKWLRIWFKPMPFIDLASSLKVNFEIIDLLANNSDPCYDGSTV